MPKTLQHYFDIFKKHFTRIYIFPFIVKQNIEIMDEPLVYQGNIKVKFKFEEFHVFEFLKFCRR